MKTKKQTGLKNFKPKKNLNHNIYLVSNRKLKRMLYFYSVACQPSENFQNSSENLLSIFGAVQSLWLKKKQTEKCPAYHTTWYYNTHYLFLHISKQLNLGFIFPHPAIPSETKMRKLEAACLPLPLDWI